MNQSSQVHDVITPVIERCYACLVPPSTRCPCWRGRRGNWHSWFVLKAVIPNHLWHGHFTSVVAGKECRCGPAATRCPLRAAASSDVMVSSSSSEFCKKNESLDDSHVLCIASRTVHTPHQAVANCRSSAMVFLVGRTSISEFKFLVGSCLRV